MNKENYRISFCIVTYNNADIICDTLGAISGSVTEHPIDVYVVDNASSDETVAIIKDCFEWIDIIEPVDNLGYGGGHNKALPLLRSKYHFILNPDVSFEPYVISQICSYLDKHDDVALLTPKVLSAGGSIQYLPKELPSLRYLAGGFFERFGKPFTTWRAKYTWKNRQIYAPEDEMFTTGCFMAIRTDAFRRVGGFDERYFMYMEDVDLGRKLNKIGRLIYHPNIEITHLWARESSKNASKTRMHLHSILQYFLKWGLRL